MLLWASWCYEDAVAVVVAADDEPPKPLPDVDLQSRAMADDDPDHDVVEHVDAGVSVKDDRLNDVEAIDDDCVELVENVMFLLYCCCYYYSVVVAAAVACKKQPPHWPPRQQQRRQHYPPIYH